MKKRKCKHCNHDYMPKLASQEDCSEVCLAGRFDTFVKKTRALARILAATMGYRSMGEVRFAAKMKRLNIKFNYESDTLAYQVNPQKYVVDFTLDVNKNKSIYLEYKGVLDGATRRKMRAVKKCNPDLDIRFVFEKPNNKLYKGAKTRYWEWAERFGFKWYTSSDAKQLRRDLTDASKASRKKKQQPKEITNGN